MLTGIALDACIVGSVDATGKPTSSMKYSRGNNAVVISYYSQTGDCTGTPVSSSMPVPSSCMVDTVNNQSVEWVAGDSVSPWKDLNSAGVAMQ